MRSNSIQKIIEAAIEKEMTLSIFTDHIKKSFLASDMDIAKQEKINSALDAVRRDSVIHLNLLREIKTICQKKMNI